MQTEEKIVANTPMCALSFFVGFYMATTNMKKKKWSPAMWFAWGLAKCPRPPGPDWDGSTSDWKW